MIDFHNHLLPGVDDGASDLDQSRSALHAMHEQGVRGIVVTPHLAASTTNRPEQLQSTLEAFDRAYDELAEVVAAGFPDIKLHRGVELMLDAPAVELSDPRLRLAGTKFVLVEFPGMLVPPHSVQALYQLRLLGWSPIVAHPERYHNLDGADVIQEWRSVGAFIQTNAGSLLGRYGGRAEKIAWTLLSAGMVDYLSSDYHARGRLSLAEAHERLLREGGERQLELLSEKNPSRMLADEPPLPVPPLPDSTPFWRRLLRLG